MQQKNSHKNIYEGIYKYSDEYSDAPAYLVISGTGSKLSGEFYASSDEFDDAREGYEPGFFQAKLQNIRPNENGFAFDIKPDKFFVKPLSPLARQTDFSVWTTVSMNIKSKTYQAVYSGSRITLKCNCPEMDDRTFIRIK